MPVVTMCKIELILDARDFYRALGAKDLADAEQLHAEQLASMHNVALPTTSERESRPTFFPR